VIGRLAGPAAGWDAFRRRTTGRAYRGPLPRDGGDEGDGVPIPRIVGQWYKAGLNRVTRHIARRTPGFGVVIHRGRRSGREYQTPVNVFATEDGYVLALTYGPDTDWVKNVLAADECELQTRGRDIRLVSPRLFHDETRRAIRPLERQVLRVLGVADFLSLKTAPATGQP
jgi:deazaflavin-dependent oxidoreductase (nitroreductase family)